MAFLRVDWVDGPLLAGHEVAADGTTRIPLRGRTLLGRAGQCEVVISSGRIAREDTVFEPEGEAWTVINLGHNAGMWVNRQKVLRAVLRDGDVVELPGVKLTFSSRP